MAISGANIASYMSNADGAFSSSSIWSLIDSASFQDLASTNQTNQYNDFTNGIASTTAYKISNGTFSYVSSPPTIDGIALRLTAIVGTSGTVTVALNSGASTDVSGTVCTCNISDLPQNGWIFFKFSSPVTLATATTYAIKFKTSSNGLVSIKPVTGTTYACILRTTTTGTVPQCASVQRDNVYMMGEILGAASKSARVITWDNTSVTNPFNMLSIGDNCTVNVENNASTAYGIHMQNDMRIYAGGIFNIGSSGTPIQATSSFTMTFHYTTSNICSLVVLPGGTLNVYGISKGTVRTKLTANVTASATSISVAAASDWAIGDALALATTSRTTAHFEKVTISSVSGTTIGVSTITNARLGTSPKQAEVINLTRNVVFTGFSTSVTGGMVFFAGSTAIIRYAEYNFFNTSFAGMGGITINSDATGSFDMQYCSIHDCNLGQAATISIQGYGGNITFSNNVCYYTGQSWLNTGTTSSFTGTITFDSNVFMRVGGTTADSPNVIWGLGTGSVFSNNWIIGCGATSPNAAVMFNTQGVGGTFSGNVIHDTASCDGLNVNTVMSSTLTLTQNFGTTTIYNCAKGMVFTNNLLASRIVIDGLTCFSNSTCHMALKASMVGDILFSGLDFQAGTTVVCPVGIAFTDGANANQAHYQIVVINSNFGDVTAHSTADMTITKTLFALMYFQNCKFGSSTILSGQSNFTPGSFIGSDRHQQTGNGYAAFTNVANTIRDDVRFYSTAPSLKVTPLSSTTKFRVGVFAVNCPAGTAPTVAFKVRKSNTSAGDAATYNGNEINLYVASNAQAGISGATLLDTTTSAANGAWESIGGTLPTILADSIVFLFLDCDGTTGWVNIDDFTTSQIQSDAGGMGYSRGGVPNAILGNGSDKFVPIPIIRKKVH